MIKKILLLSPQSLLNKSEKLDFLYFMINKKKIKRDEVISASEIGQFCYCSIAWYLQKQGFKPNSEFLEVGQKKHNELGQLIKKTELKTLKSKIIAVIGYIFLFFSIFLIFFEVLL